LPKLYLVDPYQDEILVYYLEELLLLGCSTKQAKKIHSFLNSNRQTQFKSYNKLQENEIPVGELIYLYSDDDILPKTAYGHKPKRR